MGEKRILLADGDQGLEQQFRQALGETWQISTARTGPEALDFFKSGEFEVLVAGLDLEEVGGAEIMNYVRRKHPATVRFVIAKEEEKGRVMKEVLGAHQFLVKPLDLAVLKPTIERAMELDAWISNERMRTLVARVRSFPAVPAIYLDLLAALRNPHTTTGEIGAIISKDMAISTKLLQVTNSAYFGLSSRITDPAQAVGILGFETVKSMVTAIKMLAYYDRVNPAECSIDQLWSHSTDVARSARQIALMHTGDQELGETAYTAGLLHDVGKVILAANFDQQYRGAQSLSAKQGVPLWEVETEIFGAAHGEIGAYLLGLWGLPIDLMEATALHHYPGCGADRRFSALTAVHVANALEYELTGAKQDTPAPKIDIQYLEDIGVADCLESWRKAVVTRDWSVQEFRAPKVSAPVQALPSAEASDGCESSFQSADAECAEPQPVLAPVAAAHPACGSNRRLFAAAAILAALLLVGTVWQKTSSGGGATPADQDGVISVAAKQAAPSVVRSSQPEPAPTGVAAQGTEVSNPEPLRQHSPVAAPEPAKTETAEKVPIRENEKAPSPAKPPRSEPAVEPAFPDFKLQGIFFAADRSSAIVNGQMVRVNDYLRGARVVQIGSSNIVFEFGKDRRTISLK